MLAIVEFLFVIQLKFTRCFFFTFLISSNIHNKTPTSGGNVLFHARQTRGEWKAEFFWRRGKAKEISETCEQPQSKCIGNFCASSNKKEKSNPKHFYKVYQTEKNTEKKTIILLSFFLVFHQQCSCTLLSRSIAASVDGWRSSCILFCVCHWGMNVKSGKIPFHQIFMLNLESLFF